MGESLSVEEAAAVLAVSARQVRALVAAGRLPASRLGSMWLVDAESVRKRARLAPAAGRPLSAEAAWSLLAVVDGLLEQAEDRHGSVDVWQAVPDRHLRHRLRRLLAHPRSASRWSQSLASRAVRQPIWVHPGMQPRMSDDPRLRVGGAAAAAAYGVEASNPVAARWYIDDEDLQAVRLAYHLEDDPHGALDLMVIPAQAPRALRPAHGQHVPLAVALADLLDAADARHRQAAAERFESLSLDNAS